MSAFVILYSFRKLCKLVIKVSKAHALFSFVLNCKQQIEPYGIGSVDKKECVEKVLSVLDDQSSERVKNGLRRSSSPDYETKEIKNIYIDCE